MNHYEPPHVLILNGFARNLDEVGLTFRDDRN